MEREEIVHYADFFLSLDRESILKKRRELFSLIDGDTFYPLRSWPLQHKVRFWKKPLSDQDTFQTLMFLVGNGCAPEIANKWILSSTFYANRVIQRRRLNQLLYLNRNLVECSKTNMWFYYDIHRRLYVYLNGNIKG